MPTSEEDARHIRALLFPSYLGGFGRPFFLERLRSGDGTAATRGGATRSCDMDELLLLVALAYLALGALLLSRDL